MKKKPTKKSLPFFRSPNLEETYKPGTWAYECQKRIKTQMEQPKGPSQLDPQPSLLNSEKLLDVLSSLNGNATAWAKFKKNIEDAVLERKIEDGTIREEDRITSKLIWFEIIMAYNLTFGFHRRQEQTRARRSRQEAKADRAIKLIQKRRKEDLRRTGKHQPSILLNWNTIRPKSPPKPLTKATGRPRKEASYEFIKMVWDIISPLPFRRIQGTPSKQEMINLLIEAILPPEERLTPKTIRTNLYR